MSYKIPVYVIKCTNRNHELTRRIILTFPQIRVFSRTRIPLSVLSRGHLGQSKTERGCDSTERETRRSDSYVRTDDSRSNKFPSVHTIYKTPPCKSRLSPEFIRLWSSPGLQRRDSFPDELVQESVCQSVYSRNDHVLGFENVRCRRKPLAV